MHHIRYVLLALCQISQSAQVPSGEPAKAPPPPTQAEKVLLAAADRIDKIDYVSAELRQVIRVGEREIVATGSYKQGPDHRSRFELNVQLGDTVGKSICVSDGTTGYRYDKFLETEQLEMYRLPEIIPLLERKEIPLGLSRQLLFRLPLVRPGEMLRGLLQSLTFDKLETGSLGQREVTVVEGHWQEKIIPALARDQAANKVADLKGNVPQFARVYLDEQTSWPLRIELFRRDEKSELQPVFRLDFRSLTIPKKLPDEEFTFTPPAGLTPHDVTPALVNQLQALSDKPAINEVTAPIPNSPAAPKQ